MREDGDIKIFGQEPNASDSADIQQLAEEMRRQRLNGNSDRARALGDRLAGLAPYGATLSIDPLFQPYAEDAAVLFQIRVLTVFTAESSLHLFMPSALLSTTTVNTLYDSLIEQAPDFYKDVANGPAFTFYYLALRRGGDVDQTIGATFAMLCGNEKDEVLCALGKKIYCQLRDFVKRAVEEAGFIA